MCVCVYMCAYVFVCILFMMVLLLALSVLDVTQLTSERIDINKHYLCLKHTKHTNIYELSCKSIVIVIYFKHYLCLTN